jgi:CRP-like cAMP-binding protein
MYQSMSEGHTCQNRILARLSAEEYASIAPRLELVRTQLKEVLYERGRPISYVYFPCSSAHSNLIMLENGSAVEVGTVGNEGLSGVELLIGASTAIETGVCQVAGTSLRMSAHDFRAAVKGKTALRLLAERYFHGYLSQVSQSVACNRMHTIVQRFARWLLIMHDRVRGEEFSLTQEFLATMLGVHRPSVSMVAGEFQKAGLIEYTRGQMKIVDRTMLEQMSCECYGIVRAEFEKALGTPVG